MTDPTPSLAERYAADLVRRLDSTDPDDQLDHYGEEKYRAVSYLIAGNGPTVHVTFVLSSADAGTVDHAYVTTYESTGQTMGLIPNHKAAALYARLKAYGQ